MTKPKSVKSWAEYKAAWPQDWRRLDHEMRNLVVPNTEDRVAVALDDVMEEAERIITRWLN